MPGPTAVGSTLVGRREALRRLGTTGLAAAAVPAWVEALAAFTAEQAHSAHGQAAARRAGAVFRPKVFTPAQNAAVVALSEAIIPQTDTAGAKAAKVNEFIDQILSGAPKASRDEFLQGLAWVDARATRDFGKPFASASPAQQMALLTALSAADAAAGDDKTGAAFFTAIKTMTITGYYTSEIGMREELGDDGTMFFAEFKGCDHPEHR
jgi:hypothetical protein